MVRRNIEASGDSIDDHVAAPEDVCIETSEARLVEKICDRDEPSDCAFGIQYMIRVLDDNPWAESFEGRRGAKQSSR